jgi:hypothetical protein
MRCARNDHIRGHAGFMLETRTRYVDSVISNVPKVPTDRIGSQVIYIYMYIYTAADIYTSRTTLFIFSLIK